MKKIQDKNKNNGGCYVIAEAGLNHNGSVAIAKKLIDVAVIAGANAVKFQKRTVDKLAIQSVLDAVDTRFTEFGSTYREIREHLEFDYAEYGEIKKYAEDRGIDFIATAFDEEAVDFLESLGLAKYKLASHSLTNIGLLNYLAKIKKPTIMSTGMSSIDEIDTAVGIFQSHGSQLSLMHCVSAYPTPFSDCNLMMMDTLKDRYHLPTGYSGHEIGYVPTIAAVARGAQLVERHFTLDKNMVGFDHKISLEPDELIAMIRDIRSIGKMIGDGKKEVSEDEWITRKKYHVSMVSSANIPPGTVLSEKHIVYRNPGTGISYKDSHLLLGKKAKKEITKDQLLTFEMFE
jgi:sialic acid synthase SpsE